jgi:hypothetical protein
MPTFSANPGSSSPLKFGMETFGWHRIAEDLERRRRILGGYSSALPDGNAVALRTVCPGVTDDVENPGLPIKGGSVDWSDRETLLPKGTLKFTLAPGQSVPGNNSTVLGYWDVTTDDGTIRTYVGKFRVRTNNSQDFNNGVSQGIEVFCEDWVRAPWGESLGVGVSSTVWAGLSPLRMAISIAGSPATWSDVAIALLNIITDGSLEIIAPLAGSPCPQMGTDAFRDFIDPLVGAPGDIIPSYGDVLEFLNATALSPMKLYYTDLGTVQVGPGGDRTESNIFVSCDPGVGGAIPTPFSKVSRSQKPPEFTGVQYWLYTETPTGVLGSGQWVSHIFLLAQAFSNHPDFPNEGPTARILQHVDKGTLSVVGGDGAQQWCDATLAEALGKADQITVEVQAGFPWPRLGSIMNVHLPDIGISARYALKTISASMNSKTQSWEGDWRA